MAGFGAPPQHVSLLIDLGNQDEPKRIYLMNPNGGESDVLIFSTCFKLVKPDVMMVSCSRLSFNKTTSALSAVGQWHNSSMHLAVVANFAHASVRKKRSHNGL